MNAEKKEGLGPSDKCGLVSNDDIDVPASAGVCLTCQAWRWGISEALPLIRDSLHLTKEVTSFASVLRSGLFQPWTPRLGEGYQPRV